MKAKKLDNPDFEDIDLGEVSKANHEGKIAEHYESKGFNSVRTPRGHRTLNKSLEPVATIIEKSKNPASKIFCSGAPDLLIFNNDEYFFVECKNAVYLSKSQIEWMQNNSDLPCKVIWV